MKNCRFSKKYLPLLQYYSTAYKAAPDSEKEALHKEFNDFFNEVSIKNLDNYFTQEERDLDELTRQGTPFDAEDKKSWRTVDVPEQGLNTTNLAQFMGGNIIDVTMAINELSRRIIRATVISVNANGEVVLPNISGKNEDLNMSNLSVLLNGIKMDLINIALDNSEIEAVLGKDNLPSEYTYEALARDGKFDILLSAAVNKRGIMTAKQREAVALLNNFDSILLENCKFISIKSQYRNNPLSTADKYEWVGPTVEHYSGWGDKKEYADMVSQTSDLAKAILENLPVYKSQSGNAIYYDDGLSVGVGGFYNAMLSMSQWYKEGCPGGDTTNGQKETMLKEYDKSYEANIPLLIDYYLNFLNSRNVDDIKSENFNRVITSLKNELISIKNLIFSGTVAESDLVHIFKKMVFSTTNLLYTAYGAKLGEDKVTRIGLRQTMLNAHLYSIKNAITSSIYKYRMAVGSTAVSSKYEVGDFKLTGIVGSDKITEITITRGDKAITLRANKYNPDIRKMVSSVEGKPELSSEDLIILMKDICGIMLPDNFISVCESMGYKSFSDGDTKYSNKDIKTVLYRCLIPVIRFGIFHQPFGDNGGMFASSKTGNYNLPVKHSSTFYDNIRDLANIQARIMGNTSKSIIFGIDGKNTLPVYGCTNEGSRIMELGRKLGKNNSEARKHGFTAHTDEDGRKNPYERNILTTAVKGEFLYSHVENRSSILVGKKLTSISKATVKDVLRTEIDHEFIDAMENGASSIGVQTATHADKSNQGVHYFNLAYELSANGKTKTLGKAIKEIYDGAVSQSNLDETMLMQVMYACRHKRYKAIRENLLADYEAALGWKVNTIDELIDKIESLRDDKGNPYDYKGKFNYIKNAFKRNHIDFDPVIHYSANGFNLTLYNNIKMYEGDKMSPEFKARIDRQRRRFARSLLKARVKLNVNGPIASLGDNAIPMLEYDSVYDESKPLRLNSRLEAYFQAHIFLGGELNAIELGEVYAHPGARDVAGWESKRYSKDPGDNDTMRTWSELDESVRLLAQSKRTVIPGATMHTLVQGLDNGVNHTMHLAVIDDVKGYVQNILGKKEDGAKSSDGSALSFALHGRLENNSLQDARAGVDRKTIGHGMNRDLASPQLLKFATFDITNTRRQAAYGSDIDLEDLYKRMGNFKAFSAVAKDGNVTMKDLIKLYEQWGGYDNENGFKRQIYKQDPTSLEYYRLDVNRENNTFLWVLVDKNGLDIFNAKHKNIVQPASTEVNYWYDVDQLFGGCWSMVLDENTKELVFGEGNIDMMEQLAASKTELKDCYIAMAVNSSAIKVGAMNVNDSKAWYNHSTSLTTFDMSTEFYGLQMDAEHEVEEYSDVSEMTQMISAFIENGFSKDIVDQIYRDIGECALTALQDCLDAFKMPTEQEQRSAISKILGEAYIKSMEGKDTIGLAQAFIQRAQQGLKDLSVIPVSAASISDSFISTVANLITKRGIRRKYAGFAGVQTPSYNMIQYYNVGKGTGLYRHFAEEVKDRLLAGGMSLEQFTRGYQYDIISAPLKDGDITTLEAFNKNDVITPRYEEDSVDPKFYRGKPLPKAMAHGLGITGTDYRENIALTTEDGRRIIPDVHIEDTVTWLEAIETESGVYYVAHSKRFKTYEDIDNFKTLCLNGGCVAAYKNLAAPHNLRGRTILMTGADGSKYDHFDINSVRALYAFNNSEADGNPLVFNALINLFDDVNNPEDQMYFDFLSQLTGGKLGVLQKLKYHEDPLTAEELALLTPEEVANCELALYNIAYDKKIRAHVAKLMERKVQQDLRAIKNGQDVVFRNGLNTIVEHKNLPGEIITGRVGSAKFGLSKSVDLNKIKDAESFKAAIRQSGEKISGKHGCDASVMLPNGENLLFKVCNPMLSKTSGNYVYTSYDEWVKDCGSSLREAPAGRFEIINGKLYQGDTVLLTNIPKGVNLEFKQFIGEDGVAKDIVVIRPSIANPSNVKDGYDTLNGFLKSRKINLVRYYLTPYNTPWITNKGFTTNKAQFEADEKEKFNAFIDNEAKRYYESFELAKNYAATRIPAQGMQSFMHVKTVGITDSEVNELYIPIEKMYDDGSDYDIDKGYLMGYAVEQGKIVVNSNLYSGNYTYTLTDCFNLANPIGKPCTFKQSVTENTYFISEEELLAYQSEIGSKADHHNTIALFNRIISSGATNIALDKKALLNADSNGLIAEMVARDVNAHNTTQLTPDMLDLAIKNKTLFKILQTMDDIENLPMASTSVDTVTKEPKALAGKTAAASEKKILCYDNPASIFELQITNMVGKEVIGIAAVSLKSFFAESAYFNQLVTEIEQDVKNTDPNSAEAREALLAKISKLTINNALIDDSLSVLANVNYNRLYDIAQQNDILFNENEVRTILGLTFYNPLTNTTFNWQPDENGFYHLKDLIKILKFISEVNDACYGDSGLLSLATDNAKELALAALNATSNLADIYTYLMSIGVPFNFIGQIMISPAFNFIAQMMEDNAFDNDWKPFRLKDAIGIYLGKDIPINGQALWSLITKPEDKIDPPTNTKFLEDVAAANIDTVKNWIALIDGELTKGKGVSIDNFEPGLEGLYEEDYGYDQNDDPYSYEPGPKTYNSDYVPKRTELKECKQVLEALLLSKQYREKMDANDRSISDAAIRKIANVLPDISAYEIIGGIAGINKGLKSKPFDQYKWRNRIEQFYTTAIGERFSLLRYITDEAYRTTIDTKLTSNPMKNPLVAVFNVPHYRAMLQGWAIDERARLMTMAKARIIDGTTKVFKDKKYQIDELTYKAIQQCTEEAMIVKWLTDKKIQVELPISGKRYKGNELKPIDKIEDRFITLDSVDDIATFKHFMETDVIEDLRKLYPNNTFLQLLTTSAQNAGAVVTMAMHFIFSISDVDKSTFLQNQYKQVIDDFMKIMNERLNSYNPNLSIGDAFYLYNLIVNKDRPGPRTMTRLFEAMVTNGSEDSLCMDFHKYIILEDNNIDGDVDYYGSTGFIDDCKNYSDILHSGGSTYDNPDFTFKLPRYFGEYKFPQRLITKESNARKLTYADGEVTHRISLKDSLNVFCQAIGIKDIDDSTDNDIFVLYNSQDVDDVEQIDESELSDVKLLFKRKPYNYKKARAFILNGRIYINSDNADVTDPIHEWMHLVLAGFKYNSPKEYTGMLNQIRDGLASDNKWLQIIAKQYPDAIGNDLYEEIFVYLCQMYIRDTYFTNGDLLSQFMNVLSENGDKDPLTFMNKIFNLIFSQTIEDRSNIGARAMNSMVTSFSKGAFTFGQSNPAEAVQMLQLRNKYNSQIAALKNRLEANGVKHDSDVGVNESYLVMKCKNQ